MQISFSGWVGRGKSMLALAGLAAFASGCSSEGYVVKIRGNDPLPIGEGSELAPPVPTPKVILDFSAKTREYSCAIRADEGAAGGKLICWGSNLVAYLSGLPVAADGGPIFWELDPTVSYSKLFLSGARVCAISVAGVTRCWGRVTGVHGMEDPFFGPETFPVVADPGTALMQGTFEYRDLGSTSSGTACGIAAADRSLRCWGTYNLGNGTAMPPAPASPPPAGQGPVATAIDSGTSYRMVEAGHRRTCGITATGILKCWGRQVATLANGGALGMLDSSENPMLEALSPLEVDSGTPYRSIGLGWTQACGVTEAGMLKCWGVNTPQNPLGDGSNALVTTPKPVDEGTKYQEFSSSLSLGDKCGLTQAGALKCWGPKYGRDVPKGFSASKTYTRLSHGEGHACALTTEGGLECWGDNTAGQLGDGTKEARSEPVAVVFPD